jgi:glycosyltransferase involved in cell wall biosynthesis
MPDISVLIPCYNSIPTLPRAVRSVIEQAGVDVEIILVNDASTDGTGALIDELAAQYPQVKAIHRTENGRIAAALNTAAKRATGRYFMRLDSDDWLERGALARLQAALDANPHIGFAYGARRYYGRRSDTYIPRPFNRAEFDVHNAAGYAYLFRREIWDSGIDWQPLGTFGGAVIDLEDWQHLQRMLQAGWVGMSLPDTLVLNYTFRWDGTWSELKAVQADALAEFKRRFPDVKAVAL